jgi:hypothetical protein
MTHIAVAQAAGDIFVEELLKAGRPARDKPRMN